jgi:anti-sigma regulatory factor (Ser/Thr protein kinase)
MSTATATTYTGIFRGRAEEISHVRRHVARHLANCPAADNAVLIASEFAANSILHSHSRGQQFTIRVHLRPGHIQVECQDAGGPWRPRRHDDDRPHGLDIVEALTGGPAGWGVQATGDGSRITWARLAW